MKKYFNEIKNMKTVEQIYKKYKNFLSAATKEEVIRIIEQIQKEAYNQAIDDAAKKAKVKRFMTRYDYPVYCVDKQSILKLKK